MIIKNIFLFLFIFIHLNIAAQINRPKRQPSATRHIQDLYNYIKEKVKKNQYYENSVILNQNKFDWHDASKKQFKQSSFYSYVGELPVLRMYRTIETKNKISYEYQYIYDNDGKLIMLLEMQNDYEMQNYRELKAFFDKEKCINIIIDKEVLSAQNQEYASKIKKIETEGIRLKEYFLEEMKQYQSE